MSSKQSIFEKKNMIYIPYFWRGDISNLIITNTVLLKGFAIYYHTFIWSQYTINVYILFITNIMYVMYDYTVAFDIHTQKVYLDTILEEYDISLFNI